MYIINVRSFIYITNLAVDNIHISGVYYTAQLYPDIRMFHYQLSAL